MSGELDDGLEMVRPKKKNAVFPVTQPTLFYPPPQPDFFLLGWLKKKIKLWNFYDFKISFLHEMPVFINMKSKYPQNVQKTALYNKNYVYLKGSQTIDRKEYTTVFIGLIIISKQ